MTAPCPDASCPQARPARPATASSGTPLSSSSPPCFFLYLAGASGDTGRTLSVFGWWNVPIPDVPPSVYQQAAAAFLAMAGLAAGAVLWRPLRTPAGWVRAFVSPWLLPVRLAGS
jgi:hypothetical protein